jgi:hypothetical protein
MVMGCVYRRPRFRRTETRPKGDREELQVNNKGAFARVLVRGEISADALTKSRISATGATLGNRGLRNTSGHKDVELKARAKEMEKCSLSERK